MKRTIGFAFPALVVACAVYNPIRVEPLPDDPARDRAVVTVESPVKAHLLDGSTVVFEDGARVTATTVEGAGVRYDPSLRSQRAVTAVPLDSVGAMESFPGNLDAARTILYSAGGTAGGVVGGAFLMVAIFGSCPTFYADSAGAPALQAEAFSYSIAPLFESRDVDRLSVGPNPRGQLVLEMRNEALETHYVNHVEAIEALHDPNERIVPDDGDRPLAVGAFFSPGAVTDRGGRDHRIALAEADEVAFASAPETLRDDPVAGMEDWIEVEAEVPAGTDSVAVVLRARNSLLGTVLLYDVMLGSQGARALDWVGRDLGRVGEAGRLGRWYHAKMGMRVSVIEDGVARLVARIPDAGPIAWKDVAVLVPVPADGRLRVRLAFLADQWRIDRLELAGRVRRPRTRSVPLSRVEVRGVEEAGARTRLAEVDEGYLATGPGESRRLVFELGPAPTEGERTILLGTRGYYIEWVRGDWIRRAGAGRAFEPSDAALRETMARWAAGRDSLEARFTTARVPVR